MLGIASRSFNKAARALTTGYRYATEDIKEYGHFEAAPLDCKLRRGEFRVFGDSAPTSQEIRLEVLRIAELYLELDLIKSSLYKRLNLIKNGRGIAEETPCSPKNGD
jgi:hypothetical protein